MGKMSIIATDIFFCLFGVFAVLREVAPHYEFSAPIFQAVVIEWDSPKAFCVMRVEYEIGTSSRELMHDKDFYIAGYSKEDEKCRFHKKLETNSGLEMTIYLLLPIRDTDDIEVKINSENAQCQNCDQIINRGQLTFEAEL